MTNTWHYSVFYGDSLDSLNESIRSGRPLRPDAVAGITGGFLAAAAYIAEHSSRIVQELLAHLEGTASSLPESELKLVGPICADTSKAVVWMFPGQGAQRVDLLKGLYRRSQFFRDTLNRYFEVASDETGENFLEALYPKEGANDETESRLMKTSICQPVMLGLTLALGKLFERHGLRCAGAMGHSLGEFAAVSAVGGIDESEVMRFVATRGHLMVTSLEGQDTGAMAAIMAPADLVRDALRDSDQSVVLANMNQPKQTVISGPTQAVEATVKSLRRARLPGKKIAVSHAFHSPLMAAAATALRPEIDKLNFKDLEVPIFSAIKAAPLTTATDLRDMFEEHAESPVRFIDALGLATATEQERPVFLEMGPGKTLSSFARYTLGEETVAIQSTNTSEDGEAGLVDAIMSLVQLGIPMAYGLLDH